MKKYLFISALMAMAIAINAQPQGKPGCEDCDENCKGEKATPEQMIEHRAEFLAEALELTDAQKAQFTPLYTEYANAMRAVMPERKGKPEPTEDVNAEAAGIKMRLEAQKSATNVKLQYVDRFAKVLDAKQLHKFYEMDGPRGGHHMKGRKGGGPSHERKAPGGKHGPKGKPGKHGKGPRGDKSATE